METKIEEELKKITRRLDDIESNQEQLAKRLDLLYEDRNIFETIQGKLTQFEEQFKLSRQHDETVRRDIKEEVNIVGDKVKEVVETAAEGLRPLIRNRTGFIKRSFWQKLLGRG